MKCLSGSYYVREDIQCGSYHLFSLRYNIFSQKCLVVTSSLCGDVTTARFLRLHKHYFFKIFHGKAEGSMARWFKTRNQTDAVLDQVFLKR